MHHTDKLESYVAPWYKNAPHLPQNGQKWLADNVWWIILVFVVLGSFGVLSLLSVVLVGGALLSAFGGVAGAAVSGLAVIVALLTMSLAIVNLVISALAISPLKNKQKKGWSLLLLTLAISALSAVIALMLAFDLAGFIRDALFVTLGGYMLFEIREFFNANKVVETEIVDVADTSSEQKTD